MSAVSVSPGFGLVASLVSAVSQSLRCSRLFLFQTLALALTLAFAVAESRKVSEPFLGGYRRAKPSIDGSVYFCEMIRGGGVDSD